MGMDHTTHIKSDFSIRIHKGENQESLFTIIKGEQQITLTYWEALLLYSNLNRELHGK
jgi:hypothetical protein